ncbi:hypothetical protein NOR_07763 [Metarhizium rileyi]|uniref:Uncharacterized protein n=1 Tax=Metarhizium rileyi (strain RCEF 4871) TaxID=1649241 RepID=A0A166S3A7_METRR|nr:hypothetical protein NOR_07763 [Metarhizium rileyi RCEF 4871]
MDGTLTSFSLNLYLEADYLPCPRPPNPAPPHTPFRRPSQRYQSEFALPPGITTPELPPPGLLPPGLDEKLRVKNSNHLKVADVATLINLLYVPQVDGTDFFTFEIGDRAIRELVDKEPTLMNVNDVEKLAYRWGVEFRLAALVEWAKVRKLLVKHLRQQWEEIREKEDSTKERLGMHLWHFNTEIDLIMTVLRNRSRLLSDEQKVYFRYIWREMDYWWMNRTDVGTDFELFHLYDPTFAHRLGYGLEILANEYEACDNLSVFYGLEMYENFRRGPYPSFVHEAQPRIQLRFPNSPRQK